MSKENPLANYIWGLAIKQRAIATRVNMAYPGISIIALAVEQTLKQIVEQRSKLPQADACGITLVQAALVLNHLSLDTEYIFVSPARPSPP